MKRKRTGFSIVELLTVLAIIALLVGILVPALSTVRTMARATKQRAQFAAIGQGLIAFRSDHGYYPPSDGWDITNNSPLPYCGAQKLTEGLFGQDLLGFHPQSNWNSAGEGTDADGLIFICYPTDQTDLQDTLDERVGPYLELSTANVFRLGISAPGEQDGLFNNTEILSPDMFVLCDSFGDKNITVGETTVKAGTPILYYRANTSAVTMQNIEWHYQRYAFSDNMVLVDLRKMTNASIEHSLSDPELFYSVEKGGLINPKITTTDWPYRPDSYILISAGADGLYGTGDDITNF